MHLTRALFAIIAAAVFVGFVSWTITRNELAQSKGQDVYIELNPVEPLTQEPGDFMSLNTLLPTGAVDLNTNAWVSSRPVVFGLDARNVGQPLRVLTASNPLGEDEVSLSVGEQDGRLVVLPSTIPVEEGQESKLSKARFGHYRALSNGHAVLVGLLDANFERLATFTTDKAGEGAEDSGN